MITRLRFVSRSFLASAIAVALTVIASDAHAADPTKEQCIGANEGAQSLRQSGKLQGARAQLLICVSKSCPAAISSDCAERLNDLEKAIPTIVFTAKGAAEADLSAVKVTMDGAPLADRLDGSALSVEPGEHTFEFTTAGYAAISKKLVVSEGVKARHEIIAFAPSSSQPPAGGTVPPTTTMPPAEQASGASSGKGQRTLGLVLGGAGIIGIGLGSYLGLKANSTYSDASSHCPTPSTCDETGAAGGKDAHGQATVSTVSFIAGGVLLASGVVVYLTAPKDGGLSVQPTAGVGTAGLRIGGAW